MKRITRYSKLFKKSINTCQISMMTNTPKFSNFETIIKYVGSIPFLPFGFINVEANHKMVIQRFGKVERIVEPGLRYSLPFVISKTSVFVGMRSFKMSAAKVVDIEGKPIIISAIVNYRIENPEDYVINIDGNKDYIHNQVDAVIKKIASKYPYDSSDGKNLRTETSEISTEMKDELQKLLVSTGVKILNIQLCDLNYAPEIAQSMMIKQQAQLYIDSRKLIAESTMGIIADINAKLKDMDINMKNEEKNKLVSNLLMVIVSNNSVQPTIQVNSE